MLFVIIARDKDDAAGVRAANRQAHIDYLKSLGGRVKAAGPFVDPARDAMTGSLLIVEADNEAAAAALAAGDPYARAGLFAAVEIRPWRWVVNPPPDL